MTIISTTNIDIPISPVVHPFNGGVQGGSNIPLLNQNNVFVADRLGVESHDPTLQATPITIGGTVTAGDIVVITFTYGGHGHNISYTAVSGDTCTKIVQGLTDNLMNNSQLVTDGFSAFATGNAIFYPEWPCNLSVSISSVVTGSHTETVSVGSTPTALDQNPIVPINRFISGTAIPNGTLLGAIVLQSNDSVNTTSVSQVYAAFTGKVIDSTLATLQGEGFVSSAENNPSTANNTPRFAWRQGCMVLGANGAYPTGGDKGVGTINVPNGVYVGGVLISGGGASLVGERKLAATSAANSPFLDERAYALAGLSISGWTTIQTLTPSSISSIYTHGHIKAEIDGDTVAQGFGARSSVWDFSIANAAPAVAVRGSDSTTGAAIPNFRLTVSGNNILVQIQSSDGSHSMDAGLAVLNYYMPDGQGGLTWTFS